MTKKEALKKIIQVYVDDATIDLALLRAGILDGDAEAAQSDVDPLEIAAVPVLQSLLSVSSESEGGQSISYNLEGIKQRLLFFAEKHGLKSEISSIKQTPKIRSRSLW